MCQSTAQLSVFLFVCVAYSCSFAAHRRSFHVWSCLTEHWYLFMLLPASRKWHGFWDRTWQVNSLIWHDCWHNEVKPSFAKISTMPSVSLLGGNPVWETSALCWGICNCRCKAVRQTWSTLSTQDIYPLPFLILLALCTTEALPLRQ